jgi:hypothetical protein
MGILPDDINWSTKCLQAFQYQIGRKSISGTQVLSDILFFFIEMEMHVCCLSNFTMCSSQSTFILPRIEIHKTHKL